MVIFQDNLPYLSQVMETSIVTESMGIPNI